MSQPDESPVKRAVRRLEEALRQPTADCDIYKVRGYDVRLLFETIKNYGGRKDWTPSNENLGKLPRPVQRHIVGQWREIRRLELAVGRELNKVRRLEDELRRYRPPPR
jgi:hypothetical protein